MNDHEKTRSLVRARRRDVLHLTQKQMATKAGLSHRAYQAFETGETTPTPSNLTAILRAAELDTGGAEIAEATRSEWSIDIQSFLDVVGLYMSELSDSERITFMRHVHRQMFAAGS